MHSLELYHLLFLLFLTACMSVNSSAKESVEIANVYAIVTCFVFARLDYCNAVFTGLHSCDLNRLQSIQNAAVHLIAGARQFDHVTPLLQARH